MKWTYSRTLSIILITIISIILFFNFFYSPSKYNVTIELIIIILIMIIIALSENFDNFTLGKLIIISKENDKKRDTIKNLNLENDKLRNNYNMLITSFSQNQTSNNYIGVSDSFLRNQVVTKSNEEESNEEESNEKESNEKLDRLQEKKTITNFRLSEHKKACKEIAFEIFSNIYKLNTINLIQNVDLNSPNNNFTKFAKFDGYCNDNNQEYFIEIKFINTLFDINHIYVLLNELTNYNKFKNIKAKFILLLVTIEGQDPKRGDFMRKKIKENFSPALISGTFNILNIHLDKEQIINYKKYISSYQTYRLNEKQC